MKISLEPRRLALVVILAFAVLPFFINLGASSLWDSNEAFYAETPREMIEAGDYINPTFNYRPRFNKPPLVYWVVALFYKAFGTSEAVERLPIALGALVLIGSAFCLGKAAFSTNAGLVAAIALASMPRFFIFSRRIIIDVFLAMFTNLALLMFVLSQRSPRWRKSCLLLMYVAVALGVLTKGPVAILLPGAALLIYLAIYRRLGALREMMLWPGLVVVIAIVAPWYLAVYSEHGWQYIKSFLLDDNISRYTQPVWGPRRGIFFYLPVLAGDLLPWSIFLPSAIWVVLRSGLKGVRPPSDEASDPVAPEGSADGNSFGILFLIWIGVIVLFFSLSRNKEDLYVLPVYPAVAALIGGMLASSFTERVSRIVRIPQGIATLVVVFGGVALLYLLRKFPPGYELAGSALVGYLMVTGGLIALAFLLSNKKQLSVMLIAVTFVGLNWILVLRILPDFERYKPVRGLCEVIESEAGPEAKFGYYRTASPSMVYYLRRPIFEYYQPEQLREAFSTSDDVYCIMAEEDYEDVKEGLSSPTIVLARRPSFHVKLRTILDGEETPQVLLITNKLGVKTPE